MRYQGFTKQKLVVQGGIRVLHKQKLGFIKQSSVLYRAETEKKFKLQKVQK